MTIKNNESMNSYLVIFCILFWVTTAKSLRQYECYPQNIGISYNFTCGGVENTNCVVTIPVEFTIFNEKGKLCYGYFPYPCKSKYTYPPTNKEIESCQTIINREVVLGSPYNCTIGYVGTGFDVCTIFNIVKLKDTYTLIAVYVILGVALFVFICVGLFFTFKSTCTSNRAAYNML